MRGEKEKAKRCTLGYALFHAATTRWQAMQRQRARIELHLLFVTKDREQRGTQKIRQRACGSGSSANSPIPGRRKLGSLLLLLLLEEKGLLLVRVGIHGRPASNQPRITSYGHGRSARIRDERLPCIRVWLG